VNISNILIHLLIHSGSKWVCLQLVISKQQKYLAGEMTSAINKIHGIKLFICLKAFDTQNFFL
jgi:hypothetical protein